MRLRLSISQQSYIMLTVVVLYGVAGLALKYVQATQTVANFENMQKKQFKLILIADNIKTKLSNIQNLQVQHVVDVIDDMESSSDSYSITDLSDDLEKLRQYAETNNIEELKALYKKLDLRYSLLISYSKGLDFKSIKNDPEEAISVIEGMLAISDKMNEELSTLITVSRGQLDQAMVQLEDKIAARIKRLIIFGVISMTIFIIGGIIFTRSVTRKIKSLVKGTEAFAQNKFDYRIPIADTKCQDELCGLASSFNDMASSIDNLVKKQKKINEELDNKVQEQTFKIRQSLEELEKTNMVVMDSIDYASRIQHSLLPDQEKMKNTMGEHFVIWNPRDVVGGDFYWMEEVEDGYIVALIDCTGHGVPGSLMTMISVPALDRIIREHNITTPSTILSMLNTTLKTMLNKNKNDLGDDGLDAGICYVNTKENKVTFSSAGIPLFYTKESEIYEIKGDKKGIGYKDTDINYDFKEHEISVDSNMTFYMASDGITEQVGGKQRRMMFGRKRLKNLLKDIHIKAKFEQKNIILEALSEYRGEEPQKDDMTCISFKIEKQRSNNDPK